MAFVLHYFGEQGDRLVPPCLGGGAFGNVAGAVPASGPLKRERSQVRLGRSLYLDGLSVPALPGGLE